MLTQTVEQLLLVLRVRMEDDGEQLHHVLLERNLQTGKELSRNMHRSCSANGKGLSRNMHRSGSTNLLFLIGHPFAFGQNDLERTFPHVLFVDQLNNLSVQLPLLFLDLFGLLHRGEPTSQYLVAGNSFQTIGAEVVDHLVETEFGFGYFHHLIGEIGIHGSSVHGADQLSDIFEEPLQVIGASEPHYVGRLERQTKRLQICISSQGFLHALVGQLTGGATNDQKPKLAEEQGEVFDNRHDRSFHFFFLLKISVFIYIFLYFNAIIDGILKNGEDRLFDNKPQLHMKNIIQKDVIMFCTVEPPIFPMPLARLLKCAPVLYRAHWS